MRYVLTWFISGLVAGWLARVAMKSKRDFGMLGDLTVGSARRGRVSAKGASSDVRIGIPAGTPVWADLNTVTGKVRSNLESVGAPQEGQDHIELEARTVSGDIVLTQV